MKAKDNRLQKQLKYYKNRAVVDRIIKDNISRKKQIVHGARALNAFLPSFLDRQTKDWDVFVANPKKAALALEKKLDKKFGGNYFGVKKGASKKVQVNNVYSIITKENLVDYAKPVRKVPSEVVNGVKYATLAFEKRQFLRALRDPNAKYRNNKDRESLQRIKLYEKLRGKKFQ